LAHLHQRGVTALVVADPDVVQVIEIGGGVSLSRAGPGDPGEQKWASYYRDAHKSAVAPLCRHSFFSLVSYPRLNWKTSTKRSATTDCRAV
jgi:hypothetical protein